MNVILIKTIQLFLCLSLLVVLHEGGHFGFAKLFKTRVTRFYMFANYGFHLFSTYDNWFRRLLGKPLVTKRGKEGKNFFAWLRNQYYLHTGQKDKVVTENIGNKEYDDAVGTEYGIGWLPIGGYVAIDGMIDETNQKLSGDPKPWEFRSKKIWQRFLIMFGGVLMNLITAWVIYSLVLLSWGRDYIPLASIEGGFQYNEQAHAIGFRDGDIIIGADGKEIVEYSTAIMRTISNAKTVTVMRQGEELVLQMPEEGLSLLKMLQSQPPFLAPLAEAYIDSVVPGSAAEKAGIEKGMRLMAVNGKDISTWADFDYEVTLRRQDVLGSPDCTAADSLRWRTLNAVVASADMARFDTLTMQLDENYMMGVSPRHIPDFQTVHLDYNLANCFPAGLSYGWRVLKSYVNDLKYVASADGAKSVGSFITIGSIFPDAWDWQQFWMLTAFISIILAVMNILPIPGLDGGHIVLLLYEGITGRQPSDRTMEWIEKIGLGILIALMILAFSNDIRNFILPLFGL